MSQHNHSACRLRWSHVHRNACTASSMIAGWRSVVTQERAWRRTRSMFDLKHSPTTLRLRDCCHRCDLFLHDITYCYSASTAHMGLLFLFRASDPRSARALHAPMSEAMFFEVPARRCRGAGSVARRQLLRPRQRR